MLSLTKIGERCGQDAVQYLLFQQYLILFMFILTVICLGVAMPVNIFNPSSSHQQPGLMHNGLNVTVIANLHPRSQLLWIHVILGILLYPMGFLVMRFYRRKLVAIFGKFRQPQSRTVMVEKVPRDKCTHVSEAHLLNECRIIVAVIVLNCCVLLILRNINFNTNMDAPILKMQVLSESYTFFDFSAQPGVNLALITDSD